MKLLVICGDQFHPAADVRAGLQPLIDSVPFEFDWYEQNVINPTSLMFEYDAVIIAANLRLKFGDIFLQQGEIWYRYVQQGGGLLVLHSGNAGRLSTEPVASITGGAFIDHPPECPVQLIPRASHVITSGSIGSFVVTDEQYRMSIDQGDIDIFLRSSTAFGVQPAGWTRKTGEGRVCVFTAGHHPEIWLTAPFAAMLRNALLWISAD
ncbi:MAG: ThuA domain-containing protein [Nibricoccus sp.]